MGRFATVGKNRSARAAALASDCAAPLASFPERRLDHGTGFLAACGGDAIAIIRQALAADAPRAFRRRCWSEMDKSRCDCRPSQGTGGLHLSRRNWCSARQRRMSALTPKADIAGRQLDVRFVPKADIAEHDPISAKCQKHRRLLDMICWCACECAHHAEPQIRPMSTRTNRITITRPKPPPP
jgi:hypothetical protein